ncbi:MAG: prephenate dehydrogenase/arogenate dehydrogenase family protein [Nitrospirae bacterium]|nr:prephenate dehydrogenase/arogenate dehydrogenase family protein [Nitrospirota bacterium]
MHFNKVTILGVGLIGASFAQAMRAYNLCSYIVGSGRSLENLQRAKNKKIIDFLEVDPLRACKDSDLIVLATPVGVFIDITKRIRGSLKKGVIVTDVGSVKGKLVRDLETLMPEGVFFVGTHPIAGSDRSGIDSASQDIFKGAKCIVTPTENTKKDILDKVIKIWETFGSYVKIINPEEHDRIYAAVSHLPHLIAYEIVNSVADINSSYLKFSGQGFLDTTRIASSSPELWRDICIFNRDNLLESIEKFQKNLDRVIQYLRVKDSKSLEIDFQKARALREGIGKN